MTRDQAAAAWEPFIRRSILDYKRLPREVRAEIQQTTRRGMRGRPSPEGTLWWSRLPGYPYSRAVIAAIRGLEGREFPRLVVTTEGPRRGPQEVSV